MVASLGDKFCMIDIMLHGFHHHNGIIHHNTDGQHKSKKVSVLMVKPRGIKKINVPIRETGMASTGISVARQFCKKRNTTNITSTKRYQQCVTTSLMEAFTTDTVSSGIR